MISTYVPPWKVLSRGSVSGRDELCMHIYVMHGVGIKQLWLFLWTQLAKDVGY